MPIGNPPFLNFYKAEHLAVSALCIVDNLILWLLVRDMKKTIFISSTFTDLQ
jgi:hypothetical protein